MLYDSLLFIESPIQILIVLTIALLVFGPNKLPEIGRQIGGALRELRKAAGEVTRSFTTDYEPETSSYSSSTYDRTASYYTPPAAVDAPMDLSDYTIVGVTLPEEEPSATQGEPAPPVDLADYTLLGGLGGATANRSPEAAKTSADGVSSNQDPAPAA